MFDPEVTRRVREAMPDAPDGPQPWQVSDKRTFGTPAQWKNALKMVEHVRAAQRIEDLEPSLRVYHWDPPIGFHLVVVDPFSRAACDLWEHGRERYRAIYPPTPPRLWAALMKCVGKDRTSEGYIREVPIWELLGEG